MTKSAPAFAEASFGIPLGRARRENVQALCLLPRRKASCPTGKRTLHKRKRGRTQKGFVLFFGAVGQSKRLRRGLFEKTLKDGCDLGSCCLALGSQGTAVHAGDQALCLCQDRDEGNFCPILLGFWLLKFLKKSAFFAKLL